MENYYNYLKKNGLRKEYAFVKRCNFLPIIGGKIPNLDSPLDSTHSQYRNEFFLFHSIPVSNKKGLLKGGNNVSTGPIAVEKIHIGEKPPSMTREQINTSLNKFGKFIVDKLNIVPPMQGYYKEEKKELSPEKQLEKRLSGNYQTTYKDNIPIGPGKLVLYLEKNLSYKPGNGIIFINETTKIIGKVIDYSVNTGKIIIELKKENLPPGITSGTNWSIDLFGLFGPLSYEKTSKYLEKVSDELNIKTKKLIKHGLIDYHVKNPNTGKKEKKQSNIDILDKVLDGIRPTIADLIKHNIKFLPIIEPAEEYNNFWEVVARSGTFGGNRYTGKMLANKVATELVKDYPNYTEYIQENIYKTLNMNVILTLEKLFNFKVIFISKFDAKEDKIKIYKHPKEPKKVFENTGIGNREKTDEFVDKNINTTILTGVKNNYTDKLMDYQLIYYNIQELNELKPFNDTNKNVLVAEMNKYLPYQMISIREGMMMCQNFMEESNPSFYVFLGYIRDDIYQLIAIDGKTQIEAKILPYDIKKFIIDSCGIYKNAQLKFLT
jgi:hypothetical protein